MYKVLLVDDEAMALEGLKYVLDWDKLGFSICGTCWNGKEAVESISKYNPDVVITDIRMPVMDGLELIKYTRENLKENINFIVVSGYGEFEYAKKAMQYSVRYYLQKPVLQEEIYEIIINIKEQLDQMHRKQENLKMDQKAVFDDVLYRFIQGSAGNEDFDYLKSFLDEDMILMRWNCIIINIDSSKKSDTDDEFKSVRAEAGKAIDEVVKSNAGVFAIEKSSGMFIILISLKNDELQENKINNVAETIYKKLAEVVSSGFTINVGEDVVGIKAVKHSYTTAASALSHRFYRDFNCLIFYNEIKEKAFNFELNDLVLSGKVIEAIEEYDDDKIKNIIDSAVKYFKINRTAPDIVIMFVSNMICKINNLIYQDDEKEKSLINGRTLHELKKHERTVQELKEFFEDFCLRSCEYYKKECNSNNEDNITKIKKFMDENYKKNITIRELSDEVYMHPAYLGQLFIKKFGMSFNEYKHELRIKEAKRLMEETNLKNNEIAETLGYCNYESFLQQFYKHTGMKPIEYRNNRMH